MPSIADLGKAFKESKKGKKFKHLSDQEAGEMVKAKYPYAYQEYTDGLAIREAISPKKSYGIDTKLNQNVQNIVDFYSSRPGVFAMWREKRKSNSRLELLTIQNSEQEAAIRQATMLEAYAFDSRKKEAEYRIFIAQNAAVFAKLKIEIEMLEKANQNGMQVNDFSAVNYETAISKIRLKEYKKKTKIDLAAEKKKSDNIIENAEKVKLTEQRITNNLKQELTDAIIKRDELEAADLPKATKAKLLKIENKHIRNLEKQIDERYSRLV